METSAGMTREEYNIKVIQHANTLKDIATKAQPKDLLDRIERYYRGSYDKRRDKIVNQRNVIKGIVETKVTLVADSQIKTTVVPVPKSSSDLSNYLNAKDKANIMDDCVKEVFRLNNFDSFKIKTIRDMIKKIAICEITLDENQSVHINRIAPINFFPDPNASNVKSMNYCVIRERCSPITVKKQYPEYAEKLDKLSKDSSDNKRQEGAPMGVVTTTAEGGTYQSYVYNDPGSITKNHEDIILWKLYLKDDSTYTAAELSTKNEEEKAFLEEQKYKYPHGRLIIFPDNSKDIVLKDEPIDYKFTDGDLPIEIAYNIEGETIWECAGEVEDLFENQNRINNAYSTVQRMVGKYGSWLCFDPRTGLKKGDFVNETILQVENMQAAGTPAVVTNNTLDKLNFMLDYMQRLIEDSHKIARLNEQMISGNKEPEVRSGEQVDALNESPMAGIRALQRQYKDFLIRLTRKIIILIQQYYNVPRIVRATEGVFYRLPTAGKGNIEAYKEVEQPDGSKKVQQIKEIQGDLSVGEFDIEVIAGSERPRSRAENAQLMLQLRELGMMGQGIDATEQILAELDVPDRGIIMERLRKEKKEEKPAIMTTPEMATAWAKVFSALEGYSLARDEVLKRYGLPNKRDKLQDAPIQEITKQSEVRDVVAILPETVSDQPEEQMAGQQAAFVKSALKG